jgi:hypothetical protein
MIIIRKFMGTNKMDKIKRLSRIIIAMSIIIGYISYSTQKVYYFYLSDILIIIYFIITFFILTRKKWNHFQGC